MTAEPASVPTTLNAFDIACVVIGGIIGIGIFFTPAKVAAVVDSAEQVIAAWTIGGVMVLLGAFVYARLSQVAPGDGGVFEYLRRAFGPLPAFLYGWCNLLVVQSGALAVVGLVMAANLERALGQTIPSGELVRVVIGSAAILVLMVANLVGLRFGKTVQIVLTVTKTVALFGIVALAVFAEVRESGPGMPPPAVTRPPVGFLAAMTAAILPVLFACGGWQQGSFVAGVARRPLRDVGIGLVAGVVVVVVTYLAVNLAYLDLLGFAGSARSEAIAVDAVRAAFGASPGTEAVAAGSSGDVVSRVFAALIVVSALGILNTICMAPPYVLRAMALRGLFFRPVGALSTRFHTPLLAILIQGLWAVALLWGTWFLAWVVNAVPDGEPPLAPDRRLDPLGFLLDGVVFVDWLFYGACGIGLIVLLRRREVLQRGDRLYALAAGLFALSALCVTAGALLREVFAAANYPSVSGLVVLLSGFVAYRMFTAAAARRSPR